MQVKVRRIFDIPIASISMNETIEVIKQSIREKRELQHVVVNASKIVEMYKNHELQASIKNADLINADGQAVVWASYLLGKPLPERVAGIDLMYRLVEMASKENMKCYFLGAKENVVKKVVEIYSNKYSSNIIGGYRNGYFGEDEEEDIAKDISKSGADLLFVAISSPKKELFVSKYKHMMRVPFVMGVGGSFDVVAGVVSRAPLWMQKIGLEWLFRLLQEPARMWKRYLIGNSTYVWIVIKEFFQPKK